MPPIRRVLAALPFVLAVAGCGSTSSAPAERVSDDRFSPALFADPPRAFGPQTRWWWPGAAVDDEGLRAQVRSFAEVGYGAFEIQPFMASLTDGDMAADPRVRAVGTPDFLARLHAAACAAHEAGMPWDLTFGSGWSSGAPGIEDDSERQLLASETTVVGPATIEIPLPRPERPGWIKGTNDVLLAIDGFDEAVALRHVVAAPVLDEIPGEPATLGAVVDLTARVSGTTLSWQVPPGTHRVIATWENRTEHMPAGGAYPGRLQDARILDHLDRRGVDAFLARQFSAWIDAVADCPPRAVFVDSFELVGELPWTTGFDTRFEEITGLDPTPLLPFLFLDGGESEYTTILFGLGDPRYRDEAGRGVRAREQYEDVRSLLFAEGFVAPLRDWLHARGIELRLQAHGGWGDVLDGYATADVPESEGLYGGGSYDFLRLSSSAARVQGRRWVSSETFVTVGARELEEREARLLIGRAFSAGINRIMHHGNAYPYAHADGERWFPFHPVPGSAFQAGPLDLSFDLHPGAEIWPALPALNRWTARLGYATSRGTPVAEVAWLHPRWDAPNFPNFGVRPGAGESEQSRALREAGLAYDRTSRAALAASTAESGTLRVGAASYRALLVEGADAIDPAALAAIERAADAGVPVAWTGSFPTRATGLVDADARDREVAAAVERLRAKVLRVESPARVPDALLRAGLVPSISAADGGRLGLSIEHRRVANGDLWLLFNESWDDAEARLRVDGGTTGAHLLDPETGATSAIASDDGFVDVSLPPAGAAILWRPAE
ncbi:MAG: glycosyl hydrolase [Alphaproteobacteria bacterium]